MDHEFRLGGADSHVAVSLTYLPCLTPVSSFLSMSDSSSSVITVLCHVVLGLPLFPLAVGVLLKPSQPTLLYLERHIKQARENILALTSNYEINIYFTV